MTSFKFSESGFSNQGCCVYCGDWYQVRDHVIPISYSQSFRDYKHDATVPACKECNTLLGSKPLFSIPARAEYLRAAYVRVRRKIFEFPVWTTDEIEKMGYTLRVGIIEKQHLRAVYLEKLDNLEKVSNGYLCVPMHEAHADRIEASLPSLDKLLAALRDFQSKCEHCQETFVTEKPRKYCSKQCHYDNMAARRQELSRLQSNIEE